MIVLIIGIIAACYLIELALVKPDWGAAARYAFVPHLDNTSVAVAIGMFDLLVIS